MIYRIIHTHRVLSDHSGLLMRKTLEGKVMGFFEALKDMMLIAGIAIRAIVKLLLICIELIVVVGGVGWFLWWLWTSLEGGSLASIAALLITLVVLFVAYGILRMIFPKRRW